METIMRILKENPGKYISGEELAKISGMTRAGIWKQIVQLRENGYQIDSSPRKGYRLMGITSSLHPLEIRESLASKVFGQVVYYQAEVDSTNRWAKSLAEKGAPEGTVVVAESQSRGRGRMGRSWASALGLGLWFSLILRPKISASNLACITILTAVVMARAIRAVTGIQIYIKWPNDLIYEERKLGGILAEISGEMDQVNYLVLGVGINVNHTGSDFPPELADRAISLRLIKEGEISRVRILQLFLQEFEQAYFSITQTGLQDVVDYAKQYSATLGKQVTINQGFGRVLSGQAVDLEQDGSLWLKEPGGELIKIFSGDLV